jgi:uncharacterized protein YjeT (DUF2065 family)
MDPFSKCPSCGELDVRRTRCACGYEAGSPVAVAPAPSAGASPTAGEAKPSESDSGLRERLIGLGLLAAGSVLAYFSVYEPLQAAARQEESISLSLKGAILCPIALVMGPFYLLLGRRATDLLGSREHPKPAAWVVGIVLMLAGVGLYFYLRSVLEAQGYQF